MVRRIGGGPGSGRGARDVALRRERPDAAVDRPTCPAHLRSPARRWLRGSCPRSGVRRRVSDRDELRPFHRLWLGLPRSSDVSSSGPALTGGIGETVGDSSWSSERRRPNPRAGRCDGDGFWLIFWDGRPLARLALIADVVQDGWRVVEVARRLGVPARAFVPGSRATRPNLSVWYAAGRQAQRRSPRLAGRIVAVLRPDTGRVLSASVAPWATSPSRRRRSHRSPLEEPGRDTGRSDP